MATVWESCHLGLPVGFPCRIIDGAEVVNLEPVSVDAAEVLKVVVGCSGKPDEGWPAVLDVGYGEVMGRALDVNLEAELGAGSDGGCLCGPGGFEGIAAAGDVCGCQVGVSELGRGLGVFRVETGRGVLGGDVADVLPVPSHSAIENQAGERICQSQECSPGT